MMTLKLDPKDRTPLYRALAGRLADLIERGTFRPGERIPSIRALSRQLQVSLNTVKEAYGTLEDRRLIEARPQSGYYVLARLPEIPATPPLLAPEIIPTAIDSAELSGMLMRDTLNSDLVQFGCAIPNPELLPTDKLHRMLSRESRRHRLTSVSYAMPPRLYPPAGTGGQAPGGGRLQPPPQPDRHHQRLQRGGYAGAAGGLPTG